VTRTADRLGAILSGSTAGTSNCARPAFSDARRRCARLYRHQGVAGRRRGKNAREYPAGSVFFRVRVWEFS
jgi:hypothetical protein